MSTNPECNAAPDGKRKLFNFLSISAIMLLLAFVVLQLVPSLQVYYHRGSTKQLITRLQDIIEDRDFDVQHLVPLTTGPDSVRRHYEYMSSPEWGSPIRDGPERSSRGECFWIDGMLRCKFME